jgi:hypothetical protein
MLRMPGIIFTLNHVACAGLFTSKREIIVTAPGNNGWSAAALARLCPAHFAANTVGRVVHVFLQVPWRLLLGRLQRNA